jgi:sugar (pentulose or hexulose) kinase
MDLANIPDLKPLCYSAASKLFGDSSNTIAGMGVVKNEPGVSGTLVSGGGAAGSSPATTHHTHHHHHMLHPSTYHHGYHSYDPGALASLHHTAVSHS